jgi:hypothetical protein
VAAHTGAWLRRHWWTAPAGVLAVALVWAILWPLSDTLATHDIAGYATSVRAVHLQSALETARAQLLTLGAGLFAAGALFYTARNFSLSRQGQMTDRYAKAVEQLGSDKMDVRIGGIYALERIAHDSRRDHSPIMEVLSAFVREQSRDHGSGCDAYEMDITIRPRIG